MKTYCHVFFGFLLLMSNFSYAQINPTREREEADTVQERHSRPEPPQFSRKRTREDAEEQYWAKRTAFYLNVERKFIIPNQSQTAKNVIYLMIAMDTVDGTSPLELKPKDRIDIAAWLGMKGHMQLTKSNLNEFLLDAEVHIRKMIKQRPNLMRAVAYAGKASDLYTRAGQHKSEIKNALKMLQNAKVSWIGHTIDRHFVKLDYLIKNIPNEYIDVFECLVGHLFSVLEFKASAEIGNKKAWDIFANYLETPTRVDRLQALGLLDTIEIYRERLRERILPFDEPWPEALGAQ